VPDAEGWMTLADYAERDFALVTHCSRCDAGDRTPCAPAAAILGGGMTWTELARRLRCRRCGGPYRLSFQPVDPRNIRLGEGTTRNGPGPGN
jgi:hypothetical protein